MLGARRRLATRGVAGTGLSEAGLLTAVFPKPGVVREVFGHFEFAPKSKGFREKGCRLCCMIGRQAYSLVQLRQGPGLSPCGWRVVECPKHRGGEGVNGHLKLS